MTQLPCLAHYNLNSENILTTDASTNALGATTEGWKFKTNWICKQIPIGYREKIRNKRTRVTSSSMGTETFSPIYN